MDVRVHGMMDRKALGLAPGVGQWGLSSYSPSCPLLPFFLPHSSLGLSPVCPSIPPPTSPSHHLEGALLEALLRISLTFLPHRAETSQCPPRGPNAPQLHDSGLEVGKDDVGDRWERGQRAEKPPWGRGSWQPTPPLAPISALRGRGHSQPQHLPYE